MDIALTFFGENRRFKVNAANAFIDLYVHVNMNL